MLTLPTRDNRLESYKLAGTPLVPQTPGVPFTRTAFAAAHVISNPMRERSPWDSRPAIDWDATLGFRQWLWNQGLGIAEAMDTAQRGMGLDWHKARELIERTMTIARQHPKMPRVACGAGTDQARPCDLRDADAILAAYEEQSDVIEKAGGQVIIMASRAFPAIGAEAKTYGKVYRRLIANASEPVILHWLGDMFDPELKGYWGSNKFSVTSAFVLNLIAENPAKVDGIKVLLLDITLEESLRARLPVAVRLYTGHDFNYARLVAGDGTHYSHALLGIFAAIAPAASRALEALAKGDMEAYSCPFEPTIPLSRRIFSAPTRFYKAGIAFLAWLNDHLTHFIMPAGFQSSRDIVHYSDVFRLADRAGLLLKPELAQKRMRILLALHGIE